jgi:hypothetical protein
LRNDDEDLRLVQASLIIGPVAIGNTDWSGWGTAHGLRAVPDVGRPSYLLQAEGFVGVREPMSMSDAEMWLDAVITTGRVPAAGIAPVAVAPLISAAAPIFISPHLDTPSSSHVTRSVRPGRGVLYPIAQDDERETIHSIGRTTRDRFGTVGDSCLVFTAVGSTRYAD